MNNALRSGLAAAAGAFAVAFLMPTTPVRTQDRGTSVIVANTPAEPVPAHIVNPDPISTKLTNDPGAPLFIAPSDEATFNVCPRSCGAFQGYQQTSRPIDPDDDESFSVVIPTPDGTRLTIRHVTVSVRVPPGARARVEMALNFEGNGTGLDVPLETQDFISKRRLAASLPFHMFHDQSPARPFLFMVKVQSQQTGGTIIFRTSVSGNLEPLPSS